MRNYYLAAEVKMESSDSEEAIDKVRKYLFEIGSDVRIVSITDEGGEKTFIDPSFMDERFLGEKRLPDK